MPIPTLITDLSTTAASNSPAGGDSPVDGDNFIRALSAFVASLATGTGNGLTSPYLLLTGGTMTGAVTGITNLTTTGNTILGNAQGDTLNVANGAIAVGASGNVTFAAPSSGVAVVINAFLGSNIANFLGGASNAILSIQSTAAAAVGVGIEAKNSVQTWQYGLGVGIGDSSWVLSDVTRAATPLKVSITGNFNIAAPSAGGPLGLAMNATASTIGVSVSPTTLTLQYPFSSQSSGANSFAIEQSADNNFRIGMTTAHSFALMTSNATRFSAASGGAMTMTATSGVLLTGTGVAGSDALVMNGGTSGSFRVNTTGVPYATSAHNNAGAVTGTTNQYLCSGTYTPTLFNTTNVAASTPQVTQWIRVGNVVTVSGNLTIDPTAATTVTTLGVSLPIASALTNSEQLGGTAVRAPSIAALAGWLTADFTNDRANLQYFNDTDVTSLVWTFHFTYLMV